MKIYRLSNYGREMDWNTWRFLGGCGVPNSSGAYRILGGQTHWDEVTLGQIEDACVVSGRSLARFAVDYLGLPELARVEYIDGQKAEGW